MSVSELIQTITAAADARSRDINNEERMQLLAACQKLERALETPYEAHVRIIFGVRTFNFIKIRSFGRVEY